MSSDLFSGNHSEHPEIQKSLESHGKTHWRIAMNGTTTGKSSTIYGFLGDDPVKDEEKLGW